MSSSTLPSDLLALLNEVKDYLADDTPRHALADWLVKNGRDDSERARGEFIRLQCQRARCAPHDPARHEIEAREQHLRHQYAPAWLEVWQPWVGNQPDLEEQWALTSSPSLQSWQFERGLVRASLRGVRWLDDIPSQHHAWAWIDALDLAGLTTQNVVNLAASAVLEHVNSLTLGPAAVGDDGWRALAQCKSLRRLISLVLFDGAIGPAGALALAASPAGR